MLDWAEVEESRVISSYSVRTSNVPSNWEMSPIFWLPLRRKASDAFLQPATVLELSVPTHNQERNQGQEECDGQPPIKCSHTKVGHASSIKRLSETLSRIPKECDVRPSTRLTINGGRKNMSRRNEEEGKVVAVLNNKGP